MKRLYYCGEYLKSLDALIDCYVEDLKSGNAKKYYFIVPDKLQIEVEKYLFEKSKINCFFDLEVTTFSRLSRQILRDVNIEFSQMSKDLGAMAIMKIAYQNINKIKTLLNVQNKNAFAKNILDTIGQLKSSSISVEDFLKMEDTKSGKSNKKQDMEIFYSEYEEFLKEKKLFDANDRLGLAIEKMLESKIFNDANVYITHFGNFTSQQYEFLKNISLSAKNIYVGTVYSSNLANKDIFDKEMINELRKYSFEIVEIKANNISNRKEHFRNYMYAPQYVRYNLEDESFKILNIECKNQKNEVEFALTQIKKGVVFNSNRYRDFAILSNDLDSSKSDIKKLAKKYDIPIYVDEERFLSEHFLAKHILLLIDNNINVEEKKIALLKSPVIDISSEIKERAENYTLKYGFNDYFHDEMNDSDKMNYNAFVCAKRGYFDLLEGYFNKFKKEISVADKINLIKEYLIEVKAEDFLNSMAEKYAKNGEMIEYNIQLITYSKIIEILDNVLEYMGRDVLSNKVLSDILYSGMQCSKYNLAPSGIDEVFVSGLDNMSFICKENIIVLNATQSLMPYIKNDIGLITDAELIQMGEKKKIGPLIQEINFRNRLQTFQILLTANKSLTISYNVSKKDFPSIFLTYTHKMFDYPDSQILKANEIEGKKDGKWDDFLLTEYFLNKEDLNFEDFKLERLNLTRSELKQLFFKNNRLSITSVERYFKCPYMFFLENGIQIRDREKNTFGRNNIGSIYHLLAEMYVRKYQIEKKEKTKTNYEIASEIIEEIFSTPKYIHFRMNKNNDLLIEILKNESERIIFRLDELYRKSNLKPIQLEKSLKISLLNDDIQAVGKVDRIDANENGDFSIIDIKTGKKDVKLEEVYYGASLQLFVYAYMWKKQNSKDNFGVYYFKNNNSFDDENKSKELLSGFSINDERILNEVDLTITDEPKHKSDVLGVGKTTKGEIKGSNLLKMEEFSVLRNYAFKMLSVAVDEILSGNLLAKPLLNECNCESCKYRNICGFNFNKDGMRQMKKVQFFKEIEVDGEE